LPLILIHCLLCPDFKQHDKNRFFPGEPQDEKIVRQSSETIKIHLGYLEPVENARKFLERVEELSLDEDRLQGD